MSAFFVWILLVRFDPGSTNATSIVIDNITTAEECERVRKVVVDMRTYTVSTRCIQVQKVKQ